MGLRPSWFDRTYDPSPDRLVRKNEHLKLKDKKNWYNADQRVRPNHPSKLHGPDSETQSTTVWYSEVTDVSE